MTTCRDRWKFSGRQFGGSGAVWVGVEVVVGGRNLVGNGGEFGGWIVDS